MDLEINLNIELPQPTLEMAQAILHLRCKLILRIPNPTEPG